MKKHHQLLRNLVLGLLLGSIFLMPSCWVSACLNKYNSPSNTELNTELPCNELRVTRAATFARCREETADVAEAQTCISEAQAHFEDLEAQNKCYLPPLEMTPLATATVEPGITPTPEPTPTTASASLTLVKVVSEVAECTQEQDGHFFELACDFNVLVMVEYEAPLTPAYFFCRTQVGTARSVASVELTDTAGTTTLTVPVTGLRKLYEDDDQNGAADPPVDDGDNMFTNPDWDNDGEYVRLSCALGEYDQRETSAWEQFECPLPDSEEPGDCIAPWLSRADAHTWD